MGTIFAALTQSISPYTAISFAAMFISLLAFVAMMFAARRSEGGDYITRLEARVDRLNKELEKERNMNSLLREENIALLQRLASKNMGLDSR